jgi:RHS repeat-associated protein
LNGRFGSLQGTGGLEATIVDSSKTTKGVINDNFGNGVASVAGGSVTWFTTRVGGFGPLPDSPAAQPLTDITQVAEATVWRSRRIDPTGFYYLGARYYEPTSGRFLSVDPLGHAASRSLYDFCNGDPVNFFDPDGRCKDDPGYLKQTGQFLAKSADFLINLGIGTIGVGHPDGFSEQEIANMRTMAIDDYGSWFRRMGAYDETRGTDMLVAQLPANLSPAVNDMMVATAALQNSSPPSPSDFWVRTPETLQDQMALDAAMNGAGSKLIDNLGDPIFKGMEKWEYKVKSDEGADSVVHYVRDPNTGELMDFKFKTQSNDKPTPAEKTTAPTSPTGNP